MDTNAVIIREIENRDFISVATVWRNTLGDLPMTDEAVIQILEKMGDDRRYCTFVADVGSKVVGWVTTVESLAINLPNGYIKVNGLAVLPEFQHCGIGKMLMEQVEKSAKERGNALVELASGFQRTEAHEFYEHLGYQKFAFRFSKRV